MSADLESLRHRVAQLEEGPQVYWTLQLDLAERELTLLPECGLARLESVTNSLAEAAEGAAAPCAREGPLDRLKRLLQGELKNVLTVAQWEQMENHTSQEGEARARSWSVLLEQRRKLDERLQLPEYQSVWTSAVDPELQARVWTLLKNLLEAERTHPDKVVQWRKRLAELQKACARLQTRPLQQLCDEVEQSRAPASDS